jgi:chromatin segregation and condensation protein Rec8/ScpA/Scc1 (kleisin family)
LNRIERIFGSAIHPYFSQQIDLFLRNTKKIVRDKREEAAQTMRESSQTHADNLRLLHDAQLKIQQRAEKTIQDLQEVWPSVRFSSFWKNNFSCFFQTMEQNIRKFELLFMVFHSESEFAQSKFHQSEEDGFQSEIHQFTFS